MPSPDDKRLERISKAVAIAAVFVYACGYIIITIRNANYGFSAGDLLKPRTIATGTTFALLCAAPAYLAQIMIPTGDCKDRSSLAKKWLSVLAYGVEILTFFLFKAAFIHADPVSSATTKLTSWGWIGGAGSMMLIGSIIYLSRYGQKYTDRHPTFILLAAVSGILVGVFAQLFQVEKGDQAANVWLFFAGLAGCWIYRRYKSGLLRLAYFLGVIPIALIGVNFYASFVFPHIFQRWGGGHPSEIAISLVDKVTNKSSEFTRARLLDEDSSGIFVYYSNPQVAIFIPKDSISRICYLEQSQPRGLHEIVMPSMLEYEQKPSGASGCTP